MLMSVTMIDGVLRGRQNNNLPGRADDATPEQTKAWLKEMGAPDAPLTALSGPGGALEVYDVSKITALGGVFAVVVVRLGQCSWPVFANDRAEALETLARLAPLLALSAGER